MPSSKENLKALFTNTRSRIIIVFTFVVLLLAFVIGVVKYEMALMGPIESNTDLTRAPAGISSIPGALNQTKEYAALQAKQNQQQAATALKSGSSAIPTIIRSQAFGQGIESVGPQGGQGGLGFETLTRENQTGPQLSLWLQDLDDHHCDHASIQKVISEGATLQEIKRQCNCLALKQYGYSLKDLKPLCSCSEFKSLGMNVVQFKEAGYTASELRVCGFSACEEHEAGFGAQVMKAAGFSDGELKGSGFSDDDILRAGGVPSGLNIADILKAGCTKESLTRLKMAGVTASAVLHILGCDPSTLKDAGFNAADLEKAGFNAAELKNAGYGADELTHCSVEAIKKMKAEGLTALEIHNKYGCSIAALLAAGFTSEELKALDGLGVTSCDVDSIKKMKAQGLTALEIHNKYGCSKAALLAAGFTPEELKALDGMGVANCDVESIKKMKAEGLTALEIHNKYGCSKAALLAAGFTPEELKALDGSGPDHCAVDSIKKMKAQGMTAAEIHRQYGCSAKALALAGFGFDDLNHAGFNAAELKNAGASAGILKGLGYGAKDLSDVGFSPEALKQAGFDAKALRDAGLSGANLKKAGFSLDDLKSAGFTPEELVKAGIPVSDLRGSGISAKALKDAGVSAQALSTGGFTNAQLADAGFNEKDSALASLDNVVQPRAPSSALASLPSITGGGSKEAIAAANTQALQDVLARQKAQMADQRFQQKVQQRGSLMASAASQALQSWKQVSTQTYVAGQKLKKNTDQNTMMAAGSINAEGVQVMGDPNAPTGPSVVKTGDVLFAVIDTSVNSDEPGPILATIVSGKLSGSKLIGNFNLPSNADKMTITFNTLSVPGIAKTISINAFAIDPDTARTALSSQTDHHYLMRYGSLFASTFLEGFGNAFQSADTTITIGGTGGTTDTTVQNGIGRSLLENAVIGLATVGKSWGQYAQKNMSRPTTVLVYSGTGVGVLFTQDVKFG